LLRGRRPAAAARAHPAAGPARDRHPRGDPAQRQPAAAVPAAGGAGRLRPAAGRPRGAGRVPGRLPPGRAPAGARRARRRHRHGHAGLRRTGDLRPAPQHPRHAHRRRVRRGGAGAARGRADQGCRLPGRPARPARAPGRRRRAGGPVRRQVRPLACRRAGRTGRIRLAGTARGAATLLPSTRLRRAARTLPLDPRRRPTPRGARGMTAIPEPTRAIQLGFVINDMSTEQENYTTIRLARTAVNRGHRVALVGLGGFIYDANDTVRAHAHVPAASHYESDAELLAELQGEQASTERISIEELDVLMLRSDPADEVEERPWAPNSGLLFAHLAALRGVIVLNDPTHLAHASNKTYFQHFPEEVRPATCITMDRDEIKSFINAQGGHGVIKPLQGSGGQG